MVEQKDDSLDLEEVRARFTEAEQRLRDIADSAAQLRSESEQLAEARASAVEAANTVRSLAQTLEGLATQLRETTEVVRRTDPAGVIAAVNEHRSEMADWRETMEAARSAIVGLLDGLGTEMADWRETMEAALSKLRLLVYVAIVAGLVAAALAGVGLFR